MADRSKECQVLVAGAGPVGLTMALELLRHGIDCRIIDKNKAPTDQSRALAVHARTLEIFENIGVIDEVLKQGLKVHVLNIYVHKRRILHVSLDELESPYPFVISLPQSQTERILIKALEDRGCKVEREVELVDVVQDDQKVHATLKYADGTGIEEKAQWLIACDGAHSTIRHRLNMAFEGSQYPEVFLLADVGLNTSLPQDEVHVFTEDDGLLGIFPYGKQRFRIVADVLPDNPIVCPPDGKKPSSKGITKFRDPSLEDIQKIVNARGPGHIEISEPHWLASFSINRRRVNHYRKGRIFLAGDAAHIHSPAGGQGMNTGIQDAHNLAWKLALVDRGVSPLSLLDSYQTERHAVAESVLRLTDFITRVNTLRNPVARGIRARLAPLLVAQEVIQQRMRKNISELAVNYRKSPIVAEHKVSLIHARVSGHTREELPEFGEWFTFDHGPDAGDRAPDANLFDPKKNGIVRLFEVLRDTEHHLLLLAGTRATTAGIKSLIEIGNYVLDKYSKWVRVHFIAADESWGDLPLGATQLDDPELSLHHRYGAGSECLYLIRPDGYVGFRSLPADKASLSQYLKQIFC
jgi:2-polyprenyl-6-methoxyphenol hydroxylase-like FAD-dependent oxidoreductase